MFLIYKVPVTIGTGMYGARVRVETMSQYKGKKWSQRLSKIISVL